MRRLARSLRSLASPKNTTVHPPCPPPLPCSPLARPEGAEARRRVPHAGGGRRATHPHRWGPRVPCLPPLRTGAAPALRPQRLRAALPPPAHYLSAGAQEEHSEADNSGFGGLRPPLTPAAARSVFRFGRRARPRAPPCGMSPAALSRLVTIHPPCPHPLPCSPLAHPEGAGARRRVPHAGGCRLAAIPQWGAPLATCLHPLRTGAAPALRPHRLQAAILPPAPFLSAGARQ